jgi:hypothetical protein
MDRPMGLEDIASIFGTNVVALFGAVWYLGGKISLVNHRIEGLEKAVEHLDRGLDEARSGRSMIWEKHNELTHRVTVVETKVDP